MVFIQDQQEFTAAHKDDPQGESESRRPYLGWVKGVTLRHGCQGTAWREGEWVRAKQLIPILDASSKYDLSVQGDDLPKPIAEALQKVKEYEAKVGAQLLESTKKAPLYLSVDGDRPPRGTVFDPHEHVYQGQLVILDMSKDESRQNDANHGVDIARVDKVRDHPLHRAKKLLTVTYLVPKGFPKGDQGHSAQTPWPDEWWTGKLVPWQIPARARKGKGRRKKNQAQRTVFGDWQEAGIDAEVALYSCNLTKAGTIYKGSQPVVEAQWKRLLASIEDGIPMPPVEAGDDTRDDSADDEEPLLVATNRRRERQGMRPIMR